MKLNTSVVSLLLFFIGSHQINAQNRCATFRNNVGQCINIEYCPSLYALYMAVPWTTTNLNILQQSSQCSDNIERIQVCCEDYAVPSQPTERPPLVTTTQRFRQLTPNQQPITLQNQNVNPQVLLPSDIRSHWEGIPISKNPKQIKAPNEECATPDYYKGHCIELRSCYPLMKLLKFKPISDNSIAFLRKSQCGMVNRHPLVCCPDFAMTAKPPSTMVPIQDRRGYNAVANQSTTERSIPSKPSDLLPAPDQCGGIELESKILIYPRVFLTQHRWTALLKYNSGKVACGGALISSRYVVTAVHCVQGDIVKAMGELTRVRLGEYDLENATNCDNFECGDPAKEYGVEQVIPHKSLDMALVRLTEDVKFTRYIQPVCLPAMNKDISVNGREVLSAAGWGFQQNGRSFTQIKQETAPVTKLTDAECQSAYPKRDEKVQFCAKGREKRGTCRSDSGGPLVGVQLEENPNVDTIRWFLIGVESLRNTSCQPEDVQNLERSPILYTKVNAVTEWIIGNLKP